MFKLDLKKRNQRSNCQHLLDHRKSKNKAPEQYLLLLYCLCQSICVNYNKLWKILKEMGTPDYLACLLRNLYAGQETVRTRHGTMDWFKLEKEYIKAVYCYPAYFQKLRIPWIIKKAREFQLKNKQTNIYFSFIDYAKGFDCVDHNKLWKILKEMGIPDHLTCLVRNLYAGQETVRTGHGTIDWFQIEKGVYQGCILSPCLFNLYAEYIMRNAGLDEA